MEIDTKTFEYDCEDVQELLTLLIACPEELTIDEQDEVNKHLDRCGACRQDYQEMKEVSDTLRANQEYLRKNTVFGDTQIDRSSIQMSHEEIMDERFQDRMERVVVRWKRRALRGNDIKAKKLIALACLI